MRRPLFVVCLCLVVLAALLPRTDSSPWEQWDGELVTVTGRVCQREADSFYLDSVSMDLFSSKASFQKQSAVNPQQDISKSDKIKCEYENSVPVKLGSMVMVKGIFCTYQSATNPGEFDSKQYYESLQVSGRLEYVELLEEGRTYSGWRELLYRLRMHWKERLYQVFPKEEASVLCTMLLGEKEGLDREIKALYQRNGIVHILAISGLHITLIGMSIYKLLRRLGMPVWLAAICGGGILVLYGVLTGLSVSAVRAIGMYLFKMLAELVGRTYDMLIALGVMAACMVWQNPANLSNAGFLLSYGAVLGMGVVYPALLSKQEEKGHLRYESSPWKLVAKRWWFKLVDGLKQSILASLSITLVTLPIQLWFYYEIPVYSVVLNLLVLPFMSMVMLTGLLAMVIPGLGALGTVSGMVLWWYEALCRSFDKLPLHTWNPGRPQVWQIVVYYVLLLAAIGLRGELWKRVLGKGVQLCKGKLRRRICSRKSILYGRIWLSKRMLCKRKWLSEMMLCKGKRLNEMMLCKGKRLREMMLCKGKRLSEMMLCKGKWLSRMMLCKGKRLGGGRVYKRIGWEMCVSRVQAVVLTAAVSVFALRFSVTTTITFLDVGQGDCICVETASGQVYLFDCGSSSRSKVGQYVLKPFLKYRGIQHVDGVFVSHTDEDHCNGIRELLASGEEWGITVDRLGVSEWSGRSGESGMSGESERSGVPEVSEMLGVLGVSEVSEMLGVLGVSEVSEMLGVLGVSEVSGVPGVPGVSEMPEVLGMGTGDSWQCGDVSFTCLHPPGGGTGKDTNADSQCFLIQFGKYFSILLTGDVEGIGEAHLLEELQKRDIKSVTVLKVPHHGSRNSTGEALLSQIQPKVSIISCGRDNSYGHPHRELLDRLKAVDSTVLTTMEYGAITVECGPQLEISGWVHTRE